MTEKNPLAKEALDTQRRLRAKFFEREKTPERQARFARFRELGEKVKAHEKKQKEEVS